MFNEKKKKKSQAKWHDFPLWWRRESAARREWKKATKMIAWTLKNQRWNVFDWFDWFKNYDWNHVSICLALPPYSRTLTDAFAFQFQIKPKVLLTCIASNEVFEIIIGTNTFFVSFCVRSSANYSVFSFNCNECESWTEVGFFFPSLVRNSMQLRHTFIIPVTYETLKSHWATTTKASSSRDEDEFNWINIQQSIVLNFFVCTLS